MLLHKEVHSQKESQLYISQILRILMYPAYMILKAKEYVLARLIPFKGSN